MGGSILIPYGKGRQYLPYGFICIGSFVKTALIIRFTGLNDVNYIETCVCALFNIY